MTTFQRGLLLLVVLLALPGGALRAQGAAAIPLTDKLTDLAGSWTRLPDRGTGGICGVPVEDSRVLTVEADAVTIRTDRGNGRVPLDGSAATLSDGRIAVAATDAGWLAFTITTNRNGGYANIMREVYILNRDRSELTVWRTLNVRLPDGGSGKIDCGNHHAIVYKRMA